MKRVGLVAGLLVQLRALFWNVDADLFMHNAIRRRCEGEEKGSKADVRVRICSVKRKLSVLETYLSISVV